MRQFYTEMVSTELDEHISDLLNNHKGLGPAWDVVLEQTMSQMSKEMFQPDFYKYDLSVDAFHDLLNGFLSEYMKSLQDKRIDVLFVANEEVTSLIDTFIREEAQSAIEWKKYETFKLG